MTAIAHVRFAEATEGFIRDLEDLIDRRFAVNRVIRVERIEDGRYRAVMNGAVYFPATPNLQAVVQFVRAFAIQTVGVVVDEDSIEHWRCEQEFGDWSVRVPDNVVELRAGA